MNFGNKLVKLRKENKLSQEELADKLGVSRQTISNWELNVTKPDIDYMKRISKIFCISIDEIFVSSHSVEEFKVRANNLVELQKVGMLTEAEFTAYKTKLMSEL